MKKTAFFCLLATLFLAVSCEKTESNDSRPPFSTTYNDLQLLLGNQLESTISRFQSEGFHIVSEGALEYGYVEMAKRIDSTHKQMYDFKFDTISQNIYFASFYHEGSSLGGEKEKLRCINILKQQKNQMEALGINDYKCYIAWAVPGNNVGTEHQSSSIDDAINYLKGTLNVDFLRILSAAESDDMDIIFSVNVWRDTEAEYCISLGDYPYTLSPECKR
jgi:hypothetical protein